MFKKALAPLLVAAAALAPLLSVAPAGAAVAPVGSLDSVTAPTAGVVHVEGWTYDDDVTSKAINVVVYANGVGLTVLPTGQDRNDITALGKGPGHAFSRSFQAPPPGRTTICVYALGVDPAGNADSINTTLGCQTVVLHNAGNPLGHVDSVAVGHGGPAGITVSGWAYDPDSYAAPVDVHVYVDPGTPAQTGTAFSPGTTVARPDVQAALCLGPNTGFNLTVAAGAGPHLVCVYAINIAGTPGSTKGFSCARVTVPA